MLHTLVDIDRDPARPHPFLRDTIEAINATEDRRRLATRDGVRGGRWMPRRLIVYQAWHYVRQEIWFTDGRAILSGQNGGGKSMLMALGLPFGIEGDKSSRRFDTLGGKDRSPYLVLYPEGEASEQPASRTGYIVWEWEHSGDGRWCCTVASLRARKGDKHDVKFEGAVLPGRRYGEGPDAFSLAAGAPDLPVDIQEFRHRVRQVEGATLADKKKEFVRAVNAALFEYSGSEDLETLFDLLVTLRTPQLGRTVDLEVHLRRLHAALPAPDSETFAPLIGAWTKYHEHRRRLEDLQQEYHAADALARASETAAAAHLRDLATQARGALMHAIACQTAATAAARALEETQGEVARRQEDVTAANAGRATWESTLAELRADPRLSDMAARQAHAEHQAKEAAALADRADHALRTATQMLANCQQRAERAQSTLDETQRRRAKAATTWRALALPSEAAALLRVHRSDDAPPLSRAQLDAVVTCIEEASARLRTATERVRESERELHHTRAVASEAEEACSTCDAAVDAHRRAGQRIGATALQALQEAVRAVAPLDALLDETAARAQTTDAERLAKDSTAWATATDPAASALAEAQRLWRAALDDAVQRQHEVVGQAASETQRAVAAARDAAAAVATLRATGPGVVEPPRTPAHAAARQATVARLPEAQPLWRGLAPHPTADPAAVATAEAALAAAGVLDAIVCTNAGMTDTLRTFAHGDRWIPWHSPTGDGASPPDSLATLFYPDPDAPSAVQQAVAAWLVRTPSTRPGDRIHVEGGEWQLGDLQGGVSVLATPATAAYAGAANREATWLRAIEVAEATAQRADADRAVAVAAELAARTTLASLKGTITLFEAPALTTVLREYQQTTAVRLATSAAAEERRESAERAVSRARERAEADADALTSVWRSLGLVGDATTAAPQALEDWQRALPALRDYQQADSAVAQDRAAVAAAAEDLEVQTEMADQAEQESREARAVARQRAEDRRALRAAAQADPEQQSLQAQIAHAEREVQRFGTLAAQAQRALGTAEGRLGGLASEAVTARAAVAPAEARAQAHWTAVCTRWHAHPTLLASRVPPPPEAMPDADLLSALIALGETAPAAPSAARAVTDAVMALGNGVLAAYQPRYDDDTGVTTLVSPTSPGAPPAPVAVIRDTMAREVAIHEEIVTQDVQQIMDEFMHGQVLRGLHEAYARAMALLTDTGQQLRKVPISRGQYGVVLSLDLQPDLQTTSNGNSVDYAPLLAAITVDPTFRKLHEDERRQLSATLRALVDDAWAEADREGTEFPAVLTARLDYRNWFTLRCFEQALDAGGTLTGSKTLVTNARVGSGSGAERQLYPMTLLLATVAAQIARAGAHAPRLIALDECFQGIDAYNQDRLLAMMTDHLDLGFLMTAPDYNGTSRFLPGVTAYRVRKAGDVVVCMPQVWNGRTEQMTLPPDEGNDT